MKVIFLDIDGVLNSNRSAAALGGMPWPGRSKGRDWHLFDPVAVGLLRRACEKTGSVCVLSSSWRNVMNESEIQELAVHLGVTIIGQTPRSLGGEPRGEQIAAWLEENPEVWTWAILDDDSDMLEEQKERFVKTTFREGLLFEHYMQLTHLLGGEGSA